MAEEKKFIYKFDFQANYKNAVRYLYNLRSLEDVAFQRCYIYPSARCNDHCIYCGEYRKGDRLKPEFFERREHIDRLIGDIRDLKIKEVHLLGGGEPFYYKENTLYFLRSLKDDDVFIKVLTNGNNLTESNVEEIVRDGLISEIAFNVNSDTREMGEQLYANANRHDHTLFLLEWFQKYRKKYDKQYPLINIFFVINSINYDRAPAIIRLVKEYGISFFFMQPMRVYFREPVHEKLRLTDAQQAEFERKLPELEAVLKEAQIPSNISDFKINKDFIEASANLECVIPSRTLPGKHTKLACFLPLTSIFIYADGSIAKCMYVGENYNANYFSMFFPSLRKFIQGKTAGEFLKQFVGKDNAPCDDCRACVLNEIEEIKRRMVEMREAEEKAEGKKQ